MALQPYRAPMQMAPMGYVPQQAPYYHQAVAAPMMTPQYVPQQPVLPAPTATFQHKEKAFTLHNIASENLLDLDMGGMPHTIMRNKNNPGEYRVEYIPQGNTHRVRASYGGADIPGTPFNLVPRPPSIEHNPKEKMFSIKNVYDPDQLGISSKTLKYQAFRDTETPTTIHVLHQPNNETHDVEVTYKNKLVPKGQFKLAPKPNPAQQARQIALHQQTGQPMLQQLPNGQYVQLGAPQQQAQFQQGMATAFNTPLQATQAHQPMVPAVAANGFQPIMAGGPPTFQTPLM